MNNFDNWDQFFDKIPFTFYRTSLIQKRYIEEILSQVKLLRKSLIGTPDENRTITLLEIAGGSGYTSAVIQDLLKNENVEVYFSDLSDKLCDYAKKKFGLMSIKLDSFHINTDQRFDIIFHQGFLEHFQDVEIRNLLNQQSGISDRIIFDVPNSRRWNKHQEYGNERFLSHSKWIELAELSGLKVEKATARRLSNGWKKFVPQFIFDSDWFNEYFGESTILVCQK